MPFPRMTTRRWMIVVAVLGVALACPRWVESRRIAFQACRDHYLGRVLDVLLQPHDARNRRLGSYYWDLFAKYERAASRPWLPVPPDPPPPN